MSRTLTLLLLIALSTTFALAKDKARPPLPARVLQAQTILVVIDPNAGEPLANPTANRDAREDVEKALMQWGRFRLAIEPSTADLVLSVRKGTGKNATPNINGGPIDNRPVILEPNGDGNIRIGAQQGHPPDLSAGQTVGGGSEPRMGTEVGATEDTVELYIGGVDDPLDSAPIWRYTAKDALNAPRIPALDQLRKAIAETEKALQQKQKP